MQASFEEIKTSALNSYIRIPLILSGDFDWCVSELQKLVTQINKPEALLVSSRVSLNDVETTTSQKLKSYLGSERDTVIWDGFSGLSPSGIAISSGLIRGGGFFVLIVPPLDQLAINPDPDYLRLCSDERELTQCGTHFLQHLASLINEKSCGILEQSESDSSANFRIMAWEQLPPQESFPTLPTAEQLESVEKIKRVAFGHANRPLVITADRGRGKSSALGIAAAEIILEKHIKVIITAPSKQAAEKVFFHYKQSHTRLSKISGEDQDFHQLLQFIPPDELCETLPPCHLLMVDEAAAIPTAILSKFLHYRRVVFATTIHGYEGNGRGFAIRFKKYLDQQSPGWKSLHLNQAIRWSDNDLLEPWIDQLLFLKPKVNKPISSSRVVSKETKWVSQQALFQNKNLFNQLVSLLVSAHYQTSPDDIRLILDHPKVHIGIQFARDVNKMTEPEYLSGAVLLIEEGTITDESLQAGIVEGRRRLRGHLAPQSLAATYALPELLNHSFLRVMRIAVEPEYLGQGFGSDLLASTKRYAQQKNMDFLCTSFGLSPELISFWSKNEFQFLKLGTQKDGSSGTYSAILGLPISDTARSSFKALTASFKQTLRFGLSRQYRRHNSFELVKILSNLSWSDACDLEKLIPVLSNYYAHCSNLDDKLYQISELIFARCSDNSLLERLSERDAALMIMRVLQGATERELIKHFKLSGKKELNEKIRACTKHLAD